MDDIKGLVDAIGYKFKNNKHLRTALVHSSYANESKDKMRNNERMEFLGDAVLSIIVSDDLYRRYDRIDEGDLTKLRASLVCEKSLCTFAEEIHLGDYLKLGKGEEMTGGRERPSILADAFEALIAAIYLDGGLDAAREFVLRFTQMKTKEEKPFVDYKTKLQEIIQQNKEEKLSYKLAGESGPDHDKRFVVELRLNSNVIARGEAGSKKEAEQLAAKEALELMGQ